ncbi:MAG: VWA domain-containing protein [Acidobacteria bacterium]|nr:VWA domain-containing protein [Acidobacteriota bacterium]
MRPESFWLLWVVPVVAVLWGIGIWYHNRMRDRFGDIANLGAISRISWGGRGWVRGILFLLSLLLTVVALSHPRMVSRELRPIPTPTDLVFMLDISPSMYARDMDPSRLGRAEQIIQKFILLKQPQDRYALVVFNFSSVVLSYLTSDPQNILVYIDYLNQQNEPLPATNVGAALTNALRVIAVDEQFDPEKAEGRRKIFVLLSDGDDTIGQWRLPLREVLKAGIKVYTFGLGSANGAYVPLVMTGGVHGEVVKYLTREGGSRVVSPGESKTMRDVAELTGGRFYRSESNRQVDMAIQELLFQGRPVAGYEATPIRKDLFQYFLFSAFAGLLIAIFL